MELKPCALIPADIGKHTLAAALADGMYQAEPWKSEARKQGVPMDLLVDNHVSRDAANVEVHRHEADLWILIDGTVEFEVGGKIQDAWIKKKEDGSSNDLELKGQGIMDGTRYTLKAGDVLYIPAGQPHVHWNEPGKTGRLWIIKLPAREVVPFENVPGLSGEPPIV